MMELRRASSQMMLDNLDKDHRKYILIIDRRG
jgi:hypothetical protein